MHTPIDSAMTDLSKPSPPTDPASAVELAKQRTKQAEVVGWTAGMTALFCACAMTSQPSWPVAVGITAIATMVTVVCFGILCRR